VSLFADVMERLEAALLLLIAFLAAGGLTMLLRHAAVMQSEPWTVNTGRYIS
jgi:hypothetical protein